MPITCSSHYNFATLLICTGLLDVARRTYTEIVDDIAGDNGDGKSYTECVLI